MRLESYTGSYRKTRKAHTKSRRSPIRAELAASRRLHNAAAHTNAYKSSQGHLAGNVKTSHNRRLEFDRANVIALPYRGHFLSINSRSFRTTMQLSLGSTGRDLENNFSIIKTYDKVDDLTHLTCWYVAHLVSLAAQNWSAMANFCRICVSRRSRRYVTDRRARIGPPGNDE